jgi:hypothetical protein
MLIPLMLTTAISVAMVIRAGRRDKRGDHQNARNSQYFCGSGMMAHCSCHSWLLHD